MKIAVIKNLIPHPCANVINTLNHAENFFNLGHRVEILAVTTFSEDRRKLQINNVHKFYDINHNINIRYFRGNILSYSGYLVNYFKKLFPKLYNSLDPEIRISKYCIKNKINLTICRNTWKTAYYNIINNIPTIIESHSYIIPPTFKKVFELSESKYFKGLITISDVLRQNFIEHGVPEEKILVLEDAVDIGKFERVTEEKLNIRKKLNLPLNKSIILYTGNLREGRGIDTIINSTKFLRENNLAFFIVGGTDIEIRNWKKYMKKKGINNKISFLGFKENSQIPLFLKSADILLAPYSLKCLTVRWMSPIKLFEYMASKVPIITSNVERLREICDNDECLFFEVDNPKDLSEKIRILIKNKELQNRLIQNAYNKSQKYTYLKRCKKILEFIK